MSFFATPNPDWSWLTEISGRRAALWLAHSCESLVHNESDVARLIARPWHSIIVDAFESIDFVSEVAAHPHLEPLTLRVIEQDPDDISLASNRVPVYAVPGEIETDLHQTLIRLKMFQRLPSAGMVFVLTVNPSTDIQAVHQAIQVCGGVRKLIVVCPTDLGDEYSTDQTVHWRASLSEFVAFLDNLVPPRATLKDSATIMLQTDEGVRPVDFSQAIDASYPIHERFKFVPASQVLAEVPPTEALLETFLDSSSETWAPYRARIPYDRTEPFSNDLRHLFNKFRRRGPDATCTAWIEADRASGATTLLRSLVLKLCEQGFPVLYARRDTSTFDFQQITSFMRSAAPIADAAGGRIGEIPWILAFDVEHLIRADDFILGLANGLRKLGHTVLVLAVRPAGPTMSTNRFRAVGSASVLGYHLRNVISQEEAVALGDHLNQFLPTHQQRRTNEWIGFCADAERLTGDGKESLFWVTLRFWLLRFPGATGPLRAWIASKLREATVDSPSALNAIAEVAVLSRYRLAMPARLLTADGRSSLRPLLDDTTLPLGLRELWSSRFESYAFAHPLIAEEILRICAADATMLEGLEVSPCAGLLDLELAIFERLLPRDSAGYPEVLPIVEEIAISALRVDPRDAPRTYSARDRIVLMLERAPDSVFDGSQLFLHHLAKARRHLAADPPNTEYWSHAAAVREQLELAESHIYEALTTVVPIDEDRVESPLYLHVSLALTWDVRARFELEQANTAEADRFACKAQKEYEIAQSLDPDNTYVLENFARFKLRAARQAADEMEQLNLAVDAIAMLDWELVVDAEKRREAAVLDTLASAYALLDDSIGMASLESLASRGSESAAVAVAGVLAKPHLHPNLTNNEPDLQGAIALLRGVRVEEVTWRSRFLLYQLVSQVRVTAFLEQVEILDELRAMSGFAWPLQIRLEYGILLYQVGRRPEGRDVYRDVRDQLPARSAALTVPGALKYLADPQSDFGERMKTSIVVTNTSSAGRNYYGIPAGWGNVSIPFRPYLFARRHIRQRDDMDCLILFTTFGPQAVPPTES